MSEQTQNNKENIKKPEHIIHDKDVYVEIVKTRNMFMITFAIFILTIVCVLSVALYAIETGKKRSYIIQRDANGKPVALIEEKQDELYPAEIHAFVADFINEFYTQDFGSLLDEKTKSEKKARLGRYFSPGFFKNFYHDIEENYMRSIIVRRLITRTGLYNIRTIKIQGKSAAILYDVYVNLYKAGIEVGQLDRYEMQKKTVELTVTRGDRQQSNLYGIYINAFLDISTSVVKEVIEEQR